MHVWLRNSLGRESERERVPRMVPDWMVRAWVCHWGCFPGTPGRVRSTCAMMRPLRGVERADVTVRGTRIVAAWGYVAGAGLMGYARVGCPRWRAGASHTAGVLRAVPLMG